MSKKVKILLEEEMYENFVRYPVSGIDEFHLPYPLWKKRPNWVNRATSTRPRAWHQMTEHTYRTCPSFVNVMKSTLVLPSPVDFAYRLTNENGFDWKLPSDGGMVISDHNDEQLLDALTPNHFNLKFGIGCHIYLPSPQNVLFTEPHLHEENYDTERPWRAMIGLVRVDRRLQININTLWRPDLIERDKPYIIPAGTPLAYLTLPNLTSKLEIEFEPLQTKSGFTSLREMAKYILSINTN